jgi:hypothetical protein
MNKFELKCEICSGKFDANYNLPKVLSCGHTVCSKCVDRMKDKNINKCPFDRKVLDFEESKIAINYYILSLIDTSISEVQTLVTTEEEEIFELNPKPVVNSPGWKNTLDGFIKNDVLYTVETNGFIYCTDLNTGEWWFMYHNQFYGNYFFEAQDKMYLIDQYGSLFQIFSKNYYVQLGKKNGWKNTTHLCVLGPKVYSIESSNKFYETNLITAKWREINLNKNNEQESSNKLLKNVNMLISNGDSILFSNKSGELYCYNEANEEITLYKKDFSKSIESYSTNSTHVYFFEKGSNIIYRTLVVSQEKNRNGSSSMSASYPEKSEGDLKMKEDLNKNFLRTEKFIELNNIVPIKIIADDKRIVIIDKVGEIYTFSLDNKISRNFQCLFMLRNCHLQNTVLIGDGDLLLLDPIRLSLNKLNIIAGTEVIVLHSTKFLYTIKHIFSANSKIYFIDVSGNLYSFNEGEKKLTQIGNNSICKYISDFGVHRNYLLTIENGTLYRTNLGDGNYLEIKNESCNKYDYFFTDNSNVVFIYNDEIKVFTLNLNAKETEQLKLKSTFNHDKISSHTAVTYFRNQIIYYNKETACIESLNLEDKSHKKLVENFAEINMFINNHDFLACILKDGVIFKLYC